MWDQKEIYGSSLGKLTRPRRVKITVPTRAVGITTETELISASTLYPNAFSNCALAVLFVFSRSLMILSHGKAQAIRKHVFLHSAHDLCGNDFC